MTATCWCGPQEKLRHITLEELVRTGTKQHALDKPSASKLIAQRDQNSH
jgi:hypothetical protein